MSQVRVILTVWFATCLLSLTWAWPLGAQGVQPTDPFATTQRSTIDRRAVLDLGGLRENPAEELHPALPYLIAKPLSDGRWVAADNGAMKIFDQRGRFVRTMGSSGDGPGEMRLLRDICVVPGDTLLAITLADRRIVVFDSAGRHLRTRSVDGEVRRGGCLDDGSVLVFRDDAQVSPPVRGERALRIVTYHWARQEYSDPGVSVTELVDHTLQASAVAIGFADQFLVASAEREEIRIFDRGGRPLRTINWVATRSPATAEMRAEAMRRGYRGSAVQRSWLPVRGAIHVTRSGEIWMQQYALPWLPSFTYARFHPNGSPASVTTLPTLATTRADIAWVDERHILIAWRDGDGVPHLTLHNLPR